MNKAIIYLHGFNSASLDLTGHLLISKQKLLVLNRFCQENNIKLYSPNVDYRNFKHVIRELTQQTIDFNNSGCEVIFMGSSLGGFTSEYMALKTQTAAIMINPAISPSELLVQFIGVTENFEIKQAFDWSKAHCEQFKPYEAELNQKHKGTIHRTILLDMGDELLDSSKTQRKYQDVADVFTYEGGSHGFEHIGDALPVIKKVVFS
jgi:predicted esterase YcpF (UPF0227 family)